MAKRGRKEKALGPWLAGAATPLFLLDRDRWLVAFNSGCETLTGWQAWEVVGEICRYGVLPESTGPAALAASLAPPPEVFDGNELSAPAALPHKDGRVLSRWVHFFPVRDDAERFQGVLGIIVPAHPPAGAAEASPARQLHAELAAARMALRARFGPQSLVAHDVPMQKALVQVSLAQQTSAGVLLTGEMGTGKEHFARVIHHGGLHRADWFVPLECRRVGPDELDRVWTRLVEPSRGAASSGSATRPGTVYLADVESIPRDLQERILQAYAAEGTSGAALPRLVAGSSANLEEAVRQEALRPEFLALVSPLAIHLPPLRARDGDLPLLAQYFLEWLNRQGEKQVAGFDEAVWPLFRQYHWPHNLDELLAVVREAHAQVAKPLIGPQDLPFRFRTALEAHELAPPPQGTPLALDPLLERVERALFRLALERSKDNKSKAAELLGINRARLLRRLEQLRLGGAEPTEPPSPALEELAAELMKETPEEN
ncbi:MAG: sigma 54-interacting transcriptional regulator [Planctomycetales bacterium]